MRMHAFHRTELLLGQDGYGRLERASVLVVGLGGVGSHAAEALARSGVGHLTLVDFDAVCLTNLNRQVHALRSTVGQPKADLMVARVRDIAPKCDVRGMATFYGPATEAEVLDRPYDAVLDCIDHMETKLHLLRTCVARGIPVWSAMGAGGRLDPTRVRVTDLSDTHTDPFARIVRKNLREQGVETGVTAVWSDEPPNDVDEVVESGFKCICPDKMGTPYSCDQRFQVQGTVAWMPPVFGLTMAAAVVGHLSARRTVSPPTPEPAPERTKMVAARGKPSAERKRLLLAEAGLVPVSRVDLGAAPPARLGGSD